MSGEANAMPSNLRGLIDLSGSSGGSLAAHAEEILESSWRHDFSAPGFCAVELGRDVVPRDLRALMLDLKERLGEISARRGGARFAFRSLGRFDQQETTKFHLDGGPDASLLVLGYEPSKVRSRIMLADYTRCAFDLGMEPKRFLDEFNPMYRRGEAFLARYVTELPAPAEGHSHILLINNSSLPYSEPLRNPLGVLHTAEIPAPDESARRVVNSMMLELGGTEEIVDDRLREFVDTEEISGKILG
jgi:hypothetical protein